MSKQKGGGGEIDQTNNSARLYFPLIDYQVSETKR